LPDTAGVDVMPKGSSPVSLPFVLDDQDTVPSIGTFSWPVDSRQPGRCCESCAALIGRPIRDRSDFVSLLATADAARLDAAVRAGHPFRLELRLDRRLLELTAGFLEGEEGRVLNGTIEDITHLRGRIADLKAREELCRAVAENSPAMLWMGDANGKCVFLNQAQRDFWGIDPQDLSTFDWSSTTHPDDVAQLAGPFMEAMSERKPFTVAARYRRADGAWRTLMTQANPRFDADGAFLGMSGVNTDITGQLVAEERTRMLMGELNHRTKNILSVVQAVARQTARHASPEEFLGSFECRLIGLAASNDLLLRSDWTGVELGELAKAQLDHLQDLIGTRIRIDGPRLRIASTAAQTLGMALHELSTNSLKYGALGNADGVVDLTWTRGGDGLAEAFVIAWRESGVPSVVEPRHKGFGQTVLVDMVAAALDADVQLRFEPGGIEWRVTARSAAALA
jgi:PAS domain S-box-containing protein